MNSNTQAQPGTLDHVAIFITSARGLRNAKAQFEASELSSIAYRDVREFHLAAALRALAGLHGVSLQEPLQIDANGEYRIVALDGDRDPRLGCGKFGEFAAVLNPHSPRTGIVAGTMLPENGWCRMNHFSVENMVLEQATARGV